MDVNTPANDVVRDLWTQPTTAPQPRFPFYKESVLVSA